MSVRDNLLRKVILFLLLSVPALHGACKNDERERTPWVQPDIVVEFDQEEPVESLSGFLGSLHPDVVQDEWVGPLAPKYWRGHLEEETLKRAESLGVRFIYVLSDGWGYPNNLLGPNPDPPYADWELFETQIRDEAKRFGTRVVYDVWNEPDVPVFWGIWPDADYEKFLETYRHAHDAVRAELGDEAIMSGPSVSFFNFDRLKQFADYCLEHGLTVQILSLHLLYQTDSALANVEEQLRRVREEIIENPDYASVGFQELHVNEYIMAHRQNVRPGSVLAFLRHMERAGVDGACKACWSHPNDCETALDCYLGFGGWSSCGDGSINALLTPDHQPRAVWWAYRYYAEGASSRVKADSANPLLMPLASRAGADPNQAQVIVAHYGDQADPPPAINLELAGLYQLEVEPLVLPANAVVELRGLDALPFLDKGTTKIQIQINRLPFAGLGTEVVTQPVTVQEYSQIPIREGAAQISLEEVGPYEAFIIMIRKAD